MGISSTRDYVELKSAAINTPSTHPDTLNPVPFLTGSNFYDVSLEAESFGASQTVKKDTQPLIALSCGKIWGCLSSGGGLTLPTMQMKEE